MKTLFLICASAISLAACTNSTPTAIDAPGGGTQATNVYNTSFPCSAADSRRGMCKTDEAKK